MISANDSRRFLLSARVRFSPHLARQRIKYERLKRVMRWICPALTLSTSFREANFYPACKTERTRPRSTFRRKVANETYPLKQSCKRDSPRALLRFECQLSFPTLFFSLYIKVNRTFEGKIVLDSIGGGGTCE